MQEQRWAFSLPLKFERRWPICKCGVAAILAKLRGVTFASGNRKTQNGICRA